MCTSHRITLAAAPPKPVPTQPAFIAPKKKHISVFRTEHYPLKPGQLAISRQDNSFEKKCIYFEMQALSVCFNFYLPSPSRSESLRN